jgi:hypothetical protein
MADRIGVMNTEDGDVLIRNGSIQHGYTQPSEMRRILLARAGDYKFAPTIHVGLKSYLGMPLSSKDKRELERNARLQLTEDGLTVADFVLEGKLSIDAE